MQRLIEAGHGIDILPGNHDPQLMNAAVQSELTRLLGSGGGNQIRVHNWVLHVPGVFFAEHGNQYHDINSFPNWLRFAATNGPSPDLPIGPVFDDFIVRLAQKTGQPTLNVKSILARISRSPALAMKTLPANIGFAAHMISNVLGLAGARGKTSRGTYRETLLPEESKTVRSPDRRTCGHRQAGRGNRARIAWPAGERFATDSREESAIHANSPQPGVRAEFCRIRRNGPPASDKLPHRLTMSCANPVTRSRSTFSDTRTGQWTNPSATQAMALAI